MSIDVSSLSDQELLNLYHEKVAEEARYDAMQMAFKIALNSLYGAQANKHFRYYNTNIAEGITLTGQCVIRYISNCLNDYMNDLLKTSGVDYVCANDTDSAYVVFNDFVKKLCPVDLPAQKKVDFLDKFIKKYVEPFIAEKFVVLSDYLNLKENRLHMKREAIADKAIWRGKKNYIMQVYDNEGVRYATPKMKMMGIETARSSTPKLVKGALTEGYKIILNGTQAQMIEHVANFKRTFMTSPLAEIAFPRGVTDMDKWMDKNTIWKLSTPIHVKASLMHNVLLKKHKLGNKFPAIRNGDKIKFIYLKEPNPSMCNAIAFIDALQTEFGLDEYVDKELQYEKAFHLPLKSFSTLVGMDTNKVVRLDSFFSDDDAVFSAPTPEPMYHNPVVEAKPMRQKEVIDTEMVSTNNRVKPQPKPKAVKREKPTLTSFFD